MPLLPSVVSAGRGSARIRQLLPQVGRADILTVNPSAYQTPQIWTKLRTGLTTSVSLRFFITPNSRILMAPSSGFTFCDIGSDAGPLPCFYADLYNAQSVSAVPRLRLRRYDGTTFVTLYTSGYLRLGLPTYFEVYIDRVANAIRVFYDNVTTPVVDVTGGFTLNGANLNRLRFGYVTQIGLGDPPLSPMQMLGFSGRDNPSTKDNSRIGPNDNIPDTPIVESGLIYPNEATLYKDWVWFFNSKLVLWGRNTQDVKALPLTYSPPVPSQSLFG